jgi:hypothetical protein
MAEGGGGGWRAPPPGRWRRWGRPANSAPRGPVEATVDWVRRRRRSRGGASTAELQEGACSSDLRWRPALSVPTTATSEQVSTPPDLRQGGS